MKKYNTKDACFACVAPFQIVEAITIVEEYALEADLYIFPTFPDCDIIAKKLKKYNFFSQIYMVKQEKLGKHNILKAAESLLRPESVVSMFMPEDAAYKCYYSSSRSTHRASQMKVLRDRNPEMKRVMFEDGLGTYSDKAKILKPSRARRVAEFVLGWNLENPDLLSFLAYHPEMVEYPAPFDKCTVSGMPRFNLEDKNREMIEDIFSIDRTATIEEKTIIFDFPRRGSVYIDQRTDEQVEMMDRCYKIISEFTGDDLICKPHPKSVLESKVGIKKYQSQSVPSEILFAQMADLEERVLIALGSSAVFTPKILFDQEPIVICLYKLLQDKNVDNKFENVYLKFKNIYREKDRVMAPATIEELEKCLKLIYDK